MKEFLKNKKIKVYLQYPWKFPDSPYYKYLIDSPPKEIEFLNTEREKGAVTNKRSLKLMTFIKIRIRRWANKLKLNIPNSHKSPHGNYDLIHCAHCLSKNKNKPWVTDVESIWSIFIGGNRTKKGQDKVRKILMRPNCKKILPWTKLLKKEYLELFPEIKDKIEFVYPAISKIKNLKKPKNKKLKVIFVARFFQLKGGLMALEILDRLVKKLKVEGIVISNVPNELKKKYSNLTIYDLLPHKKVCNLMKSSDIFLYPCPNDTFGFSLLESMAYGLPIVTINTKRSSRREIIENNKTGFIFDVKEKLFTNKITKNEERVIKKMIKNTSILIKNKDIRLKMSKECIKTIKDGKFSVKVRNKKLKRIYKEAMI